MQYRQVNHGTYERESSFNAKPERARGLRSSYPSTHMLSCAVCPYRCPWPVKQFPDLPIACKISLLLCSSKQANRATGKVDGDSTLCADPKCSASSHSSPPTSTLSVPLVLVSSTLPIVFFGTSRTMVWYTWSCVPLLGRPQASAKSNMSLLFSHVLKAMVGPQ
jgi:hypothetical protein